MIININDYYYISYINNHKINDKIINYILYEKYNINDYHYVSEKLDKQDYSIAYQIESTKYEYNPRRIYTVMEKEKLKIKLEYDNTSFYTDKANLAFFDIDTGLIVDHSTKYDGISYDGTRSCSDCDNFLNYCENVI